MLANRTCLLLPSLSLLLGSYDCRWLGGWRRCLCRRRHACANGREEQEPARGTGGRRHHNTMPLHTLYAQQQASTHYTPLPTPRHTRRQAGAGLQPERKQGEGGGREGGALDGRTPPRRASTVVGCARCGTRACPCTNTWHGNARKGRAYSRDNILDLVLFRFAPPHNSAAVLDQLPHLPTFLPPLPRD